MSSAKHRSISEKQTELDAILAWFESDKFDIEQAVAQFEKAEKLAVDIEEELMTKKNQITEIQARFDKES